ncbi:FadR/GntR family transcriptional regulator [Niveispirillum sp. KHB5.9]|uniref:FadR/GntR family transcriptional regulator n=1 Tax=Niveispirillum sp. KHB5.9 TaxID=3400269 RepID=UPI003A835B09
MSIARWVIDRPLSNHEQIVRTLGLEILTGVHAPGANLPAEPILLSRFGISRTALREVLKTLSAKGLLISKTRVGTKVQDPIHWNFFDADVLSWKVSQGLDETLRRHLLEVRTALEPQAAALAAVRRTEEDVATLRRCIAAMGDPAHDQRSFAHADLDFHVAVGSATGNPMMRSFAAVIEVALLASFSLTSPTDRPELQSRVVADHAAIVDAIEAGDGDRAAAAMRKVIQSGFDRV